MPGIARIISDSAQGAISGPGSSTVKVDGMPVSLLQDEVFGHGKAPHSAPTLTSNGAQNILIDGQIPAKQGTVASCGDVVSPGSSTVKVS